MGEGCSSIDSAAIGSSSVSMREHRPDPDPPDLLFVELDEEEQQRGEQLFSVSCPAKGAGTSTGTGMPPRSGSRCRARIKERDTFDCEGGGELRDDAASPPRLCAVEEELRRSRAAREEKSAPLAVARDAKKSCKVESHSRKRRLVAPGVGKREKMAKKAKKGGVEELEEEKRKMRRRVEEAERVVEQTKQEMRRKVDDATRERAFWKRRLEEVERKTRAWVRAGKKQDRDASRSPPAQRFLLPPRATRKTPTRKVKEEARKAKEEARKRESEEDQDEDAEEEEEEYLARRKTKTKAAKARDTSDDDSIVAFNHCRSSQVDEFSCLLRKEVSRPFKLQELKEKMRSVNVQKPSVRSRDLRGQRSFECRTGKESMSLLDKHPDFASALKAAGNGIEQLRLLREFYFWLERACMEGAFKPWCRKNAEVIFID